MRWVLFCVAMVGCLVLMIFAFVVAWRRTLAQAEASGLRYRLRCEECGREFELSPREFVKSKVRRSRSTTKTQLKGVAAVSKPRFSYLAKRFVCPACGEKHWCEVLNANEAQDAVEGFALRNFGAALALLLVVGLALRALFS